MDRAHAGLADLEAGGPPALLDLVAAVRGGPVGPRGRLLLALVGWPPLGVAAALILGELTGCARFAAACGSTTSFTVETGLLQLAIIGALLLLPPVARRVAFGSLAIVVAAIPIVAFLTAVGATYAPRGGSEAMLGLLGLSWLAGLLLGPRWLRVRSQHPGGRPVA